jgi:hypothetical protein
MLVTYLVTHKAGARHELLFNKPASSSEVGLLNNLVRLKQHNSVPLIISLTFVNLVTPKAAARHELLFNKLVSEVGLLYTSVRPKQHDKV